MRRGLGRGGILNRNMNHEKHFSSGMTIGQQNQVVELLLILKDHSLEQSVAQNGKFLQHLLCIVGHFTTGKCANSVQVTETSAEAHKELMDNTYK